ncbi:MAG TPA: hypothetical protein VK591_16645 [Xanthobacteraceae bacterium]|nr:hypothetical protein [Xanthobacteraceae bacterium]
MRNDILGALGIFGLFAFLAASYNLLGGRPFGESLLAGATVGGLILALLLLALLPVALVNFRRRRHAIEARASQIVRMLTLIRHALKTKSYDEFVANFSNPGDEPDVLDRHRLEHHFMMKISASCWYSGTAMYAESSRPFLSLQGGGDDYGVFITSGTEPDSIMLDFRVPMDQRAGRDARAMVRSLRVSQGWKSMTDIERELGFKLSD